MRNVAKKKQTMLKMVYMYEGARKPEGLAILIRGKWRSTCANTVAIKGKGFSEARIMRTTFKAAKKRARGTPLERLAIYTVYGYADKQENDKMTALLCALRKDITQLRERNPFTTVFVAGDINATIRTDIDTRSQP